MPATEILLIRHGQTTWNKMKRLQGHSDAPLNEKGMLQAAALAETLKDEVLHAIYASDMQRAWRTAEKIAEFHNLPVTRMPALRERCYGAFEGLTHAEIEERYPEMYAAWDAADPDLVFPAGERVAESPRAFYHRAMDALRSCAANHKGKKIAIVTHYGIIEAAFRTATNTPLNERLRMPVFNTSINRFSVDGDEFRMIAWGEAEHLEPLRKKSPEQYKPL